MTESERALRNMAACTWAKKYEWDHVLTQAANELAALHERLEDSFEFINDERVEVEPGSIPDGITCRDETIKLLDSKIAELEAKHNKLRARALDACQSLDEGSSAFSAHIKALRAALGEE